MANKKETRKERLERLKEERERLFSKVMIHPDPTSKEFHEIKKSYWDKDQEIKRLHQEI